MSRAKSVFSFRILTRLQKLAGKAARICEEWIEASRNVLIGPANAAEEELPLSQKSAAK